MAEWIDFYTFIEDVSVQDITDATSERLYMGGDAAALLSDAGYTPDPITQDLAHTQTEDGVTVARSDIGELPAYRIIAPADQPLARASA